MALELNQSILGSFWRISQATDMLEQKVQQFWNLLTQTVLMVPYIFDQKIFDLKRGILKTLKFCGNL